MSTTFRKKQLYEDAAKENGVYPVTVTDAVFDGNGDDLDTILQDLNDLIQNKQDALVSGTNIKTINNESILGSGNLIVNADTSDKVSKSGDTMTGQLHTSFLDSVAMGSYGSNQSTIPDLVNELRYSSGASGSANITTAYTLSGVTVPAGWYNYLWIPHRSGGDSGAASGDNCNYGSLYLSGMTVSGLYMIRYSSSSIAELKNLYSTASHTHGHITNAGDITTNVAIASGDRLVINDESASQLNNSSITFGSSTTTYLTNKGTWVTPPGLWGINTGNVIATYNGGTENTEVTYTATQDCWVRGVSSDANSSAEASKGARIDGSKYSLTGNYSGYAYDTFPLRKGQKIVVSGNTRYATRVIVWGVK